MIFEKSTRVDTVQDGYYIGLEFMLGGADNYIESKIGPLSETTARLFCRFLERLLVRINDSYDDDTLTPAQLTELEMWQYGVSDEDISNLTGIIESDIELYKNKDIADEIKRGKFQWVYDNNYDRYAPCEKFHVIYVEDNKTYNVRVQIEPEDLYATDSTQA